MEAMLSVRPPPFLLNCSTAGNARRHSRLKLRTAAASQGPGGAAAAGGPETFLTVEEAGLIEMSGLNMHERFLARLTVSSLNLLKTISKQEGVTIETLNVGKICDWFIKDKAKGTDATLKWDSGPDW